MSEVLGSPLAVRPRSRFEWLVAFLRAGWRPFAGWTCGLILLVQGVGLPIAGRVFGFEVATLNWRDLAVFVGTILGLGAARSLEKILGASE